MKNAQNAFFVYGSLMHGYFNHEKAFQGQQICRVPAKTRGTLFSQTSKGYPAMTQGNEWVYGELITPQDFSKSLALCDKIENYFGPDGDNEYDRILVTVEGLKGQTLCQAYAYLYARQDLGTPDNPVVALPDGDWNAYMQGIKR